MVNIFLSYFSKSKFAFGVIISLITSILIVVTGIEYANLIKKDWIYLPITGLLFFILFGWYVKIMEERWQKKV